MAQTGREQCIDRRASKPSPASKIELLMMKAQCDQHLEGILCRESDGRGTLRGIAACAIAALGIRGRGSFECQSDQVEWRILGVNHQNEIAAHPCPKRREPIRWRQCAELDKSCVRRLQHLRPTTMNPGCR